MSNIDKDIMDDIKEDIVKEPVKKTRTRVAKKKEIKATTHDNAKVTNKKNGCKIIDY